MNQIKFLLVSICMSVFINCYGQVKNFGFRSGVSLSNFYQHNDFSTITKTTVQPVQGGTAIIISGREGMSNYETNLIQDLRVGFYSYVYMDWEIKNRLSTQVGLGYAQKGINLNYSLETTTELPNTTEKLSHRFNRNLRLDYLVIPLTLEYKLDKKERFYVLGGIYNSILVNFLIRESLVETTEQIYFNSDGVSSTSESYQYGFPVTYASRFDSGLLAGFGINWPLTQKWTIGADIRSGIGLISIPRKFDTNGFQSFHERSKNISFETGLNMRYILN
ncbi:MAG: PorT family protein [Bacteroidota bacterium]|nr:PorT family protein [Bacteroidota bacterium]